MLRFKLDAGGPKAVPLPALPDDPLSGIQPDKVPRRETGQDPKGYSKAALANEAVVFRTSNRHGSVLARFAIQCDAHIRFLQRAVVPATDPVVGSDVEVAGAFNAGHDPIMRDVIAIEGRYDEGRSVSWLEVADHRFEHDDDSHVCHDHDRDNSCSLHGLTSRQASVAQRIGVQLRATAPLWLARSARVDCETVPRLGGTELWIVSCNAMLGCTPLTTEAANSPAGDVRERPQR